MSPVACELLGIGRAPSSVNSWEYKGDEQAAASSRGSRRPAGSRRGAAGDAARARPGRGRDSAGPGPSHSAAYMLLSVNSSVGLCVSRSFKVGFFAKIRGFLKQEGKTKFVQIFTMLYVQIFTAPMCRHSRPHMCRCSRPLCCAGAGIHSPHVQTDVHGPFVQIHVFTPPMCCHASNRVSWPFRV